MIRPFTLLCFGAFAAAGAWLYQVKHQVSVQDRQLVEIRRQTEQARQRIDILRAEWALLNEPDRLRQTASRVLSLEPMQPQHFVRAAELERRLPGAIAFAGAPDLFAAPPVTAPPAAPGIAPGNAPGAAPPGLTPQRAPQVMLASAIVAAPVVATARPAQPVAAPAGVRVPEAPAPQALAAALAAQRAEQASRVAAPPPPPRPAAPPVQAAAPQPPAPRPLQPAVHVVPVSAPAEPVTRVTRAAPVETSFASALGGVTTLGRPSLAPPVPMGSAAAASLAPPAGR